MKITDKLQQAASSGAPAFSLEFFPPKTEQGFTNLRTRLHRLSLLQPTFVSITWGAGGSTEERTMDLAAAARELGLDVLLHLTCTNMEKDKLDSALKRAKEMGIQNVLALRGDAPRGHEYWISTDDRFQHGSDLVRYIREQHGDYFCIGVAGYPEGHADSSDKSADVAHLKIKIDAGADFVITQLFYDCDAYLRWLRECRKAGINVPIIPGIMPIQNVSSLRRMTNLCGATLPHVIAEHLEPIKHDDATVKDYGISLSTSMITTLMRTTQSDAETYGPLAVRAAHFCTLNLEKSVRRILENLGWQGGLDSASLEESGLLQAERERDEERRKNEIARLGNRLVAQNNSAYTTPTSAPPPLTISAHEAALRAQHSFVAHPPSEASGLPPSSKTSAGGNSLWDEFPNGRYGDVRSPAYGELDGWGTGLKITPQQALAQWGTPVDTHDLTHIFLAYLAGRIPSLPWFEDPLHAESETIMPYLRAFARRGWWTVGSQPAVDGARSDDPVFGFGPRGGWIFQKAFVEFWVPRGELEELVRRLEKWEGGGYYAGNRKGEFRTNFLPDAINAVTWGIFPGKEIVQSTIIEEVSFNAWKEEAFDIWREWAMLYPAQSASRKLLDSIGEEYWLVSVVYHDYKDADGLWRFLLGDEATNGADVDGKQ